MHLIFERGDHDAPAGHALIYFRADDGAVLATYVTIFPIAFDMTQYMPGFLAEAMKGMELGGAVATPMPPMPEEISSVEYLQALAERRGDDLVFAGGTTRSDPMRGAADAAEAARSYNELYEGSTVPSPDAAPAPARDLDAERYSGMTEREKLDELRILTGRLRDSLRDGAPDVDVERQMRLLGDTLPAKYRVSALIDAARTPGDRGQKLAELLLVRSYKLLNEEYLDLEQIDRDIEAIQG